MKFVVAVDKAWGIGYKGDLLARVKGDLKNFRVLTKNKVVVYGSNTLATFPGGKVLPNRVNIVLNWDLDYHPEGAIVVHSLDELFEELKKYDTNDVFVIGGASIYNQFLPYCNVAYVTKIDFHYEADTFFPNLDEDPEWECVEEGEEQTYYDIEYRFTKYVRKASVSQTE